VDNLYYFGSAPGVTVNLNLTTAQVSAGDASGDILSGIEDVYGTTGNDILTGNAAANLLQGGSGNDTLNGDGGNDILDGGSGDDTLIGGAGDDDLYGGTGIDSLNGGAGIDTVSYNFSIGVTINLTLTTAQISAGDASGDILSGIENVYGSYLGDDILIGDGNANHLYGQNGNDRLVGGSGSDLLYGGFGDDHLDGGSGNDSLWGHGGTDTFNFKLGFGQDIIHDFEDNLDKLSFDLSVADNFNDFVITGNGTTSVTVTQGTETIVVAGVSVITLTASDFLFS
jgi:Ca2+-binding RTX toxin-like protein